jgi:hypothetical protein
VSKQSFEDGVPKLELGYEEDEDARAALELGYEGNEGARNSVRMRASH